MPHITNGSRRAQGARADTHSRGIVEVRHTESLAFRLTLTVKHEYSSRDRLLKRFLRKRNKEGKMNPKKMVALIALLPVIMLAVPNIASADINGRHLRIAVLKAFK